MILLVFLLGQPAQFCVQFSLFRLSIVQIIMLLSNLKRTTEKNYEEVEKHVTSEKLFLKKTIFPWKMKTKEMNRCQIRFGSLC